MKTEEKKPAFPAQHQEHQPGSEAAMKPRPAPEEADYRGSGKLKGKVALITGGDSGIGRAAAIAFAKEGANLVVGYFDEQQDAEETKRRVEQVGRECVLLAGDVGDPEFCRRMVETTVSKFGKLDV